MEDELEQTTDNDEIKQESLEHIMSLDPLVYIKITEDEWLRSQLI